MAVQEQIHSGVRVCVEGDGESRLYVLVGFLFLFFFYPPCVYLSINIVKRSRRCHQLVYHRITYQYLKVI